MIVNSFSQYKRENTFQINEGGTGFNSLDDFKTYLCNILYPIGSILITTSSQNPQLYFPNTNWEKLDDNLLLKSGNNYEKNGNNTFSLNSINYIKNHYHSISGTTVDGQGVHTHTIYARSTSSWSQDQIESFGRGILVYPENGAWHGGNWLSGEHSHSCPSITTGYTGTSSPSLNIMPKGYGVYFWVRISNEIF